MSSCCEAESAPAEEHAPCVPRSQPISINPPTAGQDPTAQETPPKDSGIAVTSLTPQSIKSPSPVKTTVVQEASTAAAKNPPSPTANEPIVIKNPTSRDHRIPIEDGSGCAAGNDREDAAQDNYNSAIQEEDECAIEDDDSSTQSFHLPTIPLRFRPTNITKYVRFALPAPPMDNSNLRPDPSEKQSNNPSLLSRALNRQGPATSGAPNTTTCPGASNRAVNLSPSVAPIPSHQYRSRGAHVRLDSARIPNGDPNSKERCSSTDLLAYPPPDRSQAVKELQGFFDDYERQRPIPPSFPLARYLDAYAIDVDDFAQEVDQNLARENQLWQSVDATNRQLEAIRQNKQHIKKLIRTRSAAEGSEVETTEQETRHWRYLKGQEKVLDSELKDLSKRMRALHDHGVNLVQNNLEKDWGDLAEIQATRAPRPHTKGEPVGQPVFVVSETGVRGVSYQGNPIANLRGRHRPHTSRPGKHSLLNPVRDLQVEPRWLDSEGEATENRSQGVPLPALDAVPVPQWFRIFDQKSLVPLRRPNDSGKFTELNNIIWDLESRIADKAKWDDNDEVYVALQGMNLQEKHSWLMSQIGGARTAALEQEKGAIKAQVRMAWERQ